MKLHAIISRFPTTHTAGTVSLVCILLQFISARGQDAESYINMKGTDFSVERHLSLRCASDTPCVVFKELLHQTITVNLSGFFEDRKVYLTFEVPAKEGAHRLRLDKDGDPKPEENFLLEIDGPAAPADRFTYTLLETNDEAMVRIRSISPESRSVSGEFNARFHDNARFVKTGEFSGSFTITGSGQ
ncbi:MAG: hypothetical protein IT242_00935 [Bacteroidia bacterium]|nr:hypothetical protein [Bacteroidia bacterium]